MKLYLDTSALLRRYFDEPESDQVVAWLNAPHVKVVSGLVFVELASVFRRALRGRQITRAQHGRLTAEARQDLRHLRVQGASEEIFRQAALVADLTGLRTLDSLHLASARAAGADRILTFDRELAQAAAKLGIRSLA